MAGPRVQELSILFIPLLSFVPALWIYRDAEKRGVSAIAWLIAWFVGTIFALVIWLFGRPRPQASVTSSARGRAFER